MQRVERVPRGPRSTERIAGARGKRNGADLSGYHVPRTRRPPSYRWYLSWLRMATGTGNNPSTPTYQPFPSPPRTYHSGSLWGPRCSESERGESSPGDRRHREAGSWSMLVDPPRSSADDARGTEARSCHEHIVPPRQRVVTRCYFAVAVDVGSIDRIATCHCTRPSPPPRRPVHPVSLARRG